MLRWAFLFYMIIKNQGVNTFGIQADWFSQTIKAMYKSFQNNWPSLYNLLNSKIFDYLKHEVFGIRSTTFNPKQWYIPPLSRYYLYWPIPKDIIYSKISPHFFQNYAFNSQSKKWLTNFSHSKIQSWVRW